MPPISLSYIKEKWQHAGFQKYLKNTGWMFGGRVFSLVVSLFVSIFIARKLGPEQYGTLNFIISFVSIAGFTLFAIDSLLIKKLNNEPENTNKILGSALLIKLINSFFTIIASTVAALFFAHNQSTTFLILIYSTFSIFQSFNIVDFYFQTHAKNKPISLMTISTGLISSITKLLIVIYGLPIIYLLLSYVFDHLINATGYAYLYKKYVDRLNWRPTKKLLHYFIINSWPFSLSAVAASIYIRIDQIFIKVLMGSEAVGIYAIAVRFSEVWFFISSVICASLLPAILNAQKTNHDLFLARSKKLYTLLFYSALLISIFIFMIAPNIINSFYGTSYINSVPILRIYIWSIIGVFVGTALQHFLLAQNKFKTILSFNITGMLITLILNYLLIPMYGIKGAAIANIFAYSLPFLIIISLKGLREQRKAFISAIFRPFHND
jgi:O-antigen/teichoic acid export membrane protein